MADQTTNPTVKMASLNAINFAWEKYQAAVSMFWAFPGELAEQGFGYADFHGLACPALINDAPTHAQIDALIKYAKRVIEAGKAFKLAADAAAFEEAKANEEKLGDRIQRILDTLEKLSGKMDGADELKEKLSQLQEDLAHGADHDKGFRLCGYVDAQITLHKMGVVKSVVTSRNRGWLITRDGQTGRHANAYRKLGLPEKVANWLGRQPADKAPYQEKKAWIKEGWELLKNVEAPWGTCHGSVCGGKGALTPGRDGQVQKKCGKCFHAQSGTVSTRMKLDPMVELSAGMAEDPSAFAGITVDGKTPVRVREESEVVEEMPEAEVKRKPGGKKTRASKRVQAEQEAE